MCYMQYREGYVVDVRKAGYEKNNWHTGEGTVWETLRACRSLMKSIC